MTERNLAIRLSVMDGGKVKAELKEIGETGEKSLQRIELAGKPASKSLLALNAAANDVKGTAIGLSSQMGPLGAGMIALGPAGIVAGAGLAAIGLGLKASINEASLAEQAQNRLQGVLKATGYASGLTGKDIAELAEEMERSTLTTAESVKSAAAILATFRSVSGDTFTTAIRLAQDMSAVFGQDLTSSATQLGKALEDPIAGITALKRVGVSFSDSQRDMINNLVETGQKAEAQKVILKALEEQVGGAGAAEAGGLAGATHKVSIAWGDMLKVIGQTETVSGIAQSALHQLMVTFDVTAELFKKTPISVQLQKAKDDLLDTQKSLDWLQNLPDAVKPLYKDNTDLRQKKAAQLREEIEKLTKAEEAEAAEKAKAESGRAAAEKEGRADVLFEQRKSLDEAIAKLVDDPAEKIAKINKELEVTKKRLEGLRDPVSTGATAGPDGGGNNANVDAAIKQAEELARRQTETIQKPLAEAAQKEAEANQKVMDDLKRQLLGLGDARQAFIDQAVSRLSNKAGDGEKSQTRNLAAQLFDEKAFADAEKIIIDLGKQMDKLSDKRKAFIQEAVVRLPETATQDQIDRTKELAAALFDQAEAQAALDKLKEEGKQLTDSSRTATEACADQIARLTEMLDAGAISQEVFNKSKSKASDDELAGRTDGQAGAIRAFHSYQKEAEDTAGAVEKAFSEAMKATEDAIVNMVTSGKVSLNSLDDLANSIVADITRMMVQKSITGPLFKALSDSIGGGDGGGSGGSNFFGDLFSSIFHEGGTVGDHAPARQLPAYVFAGAPRYHSGGIAGLQPGEIPAILQRGEVVLPKNSSRGSTPVNIVMHISTPDANSFRASQAQISAEAARGISRARRNL